MEPGNVDGVISLAASHYRENIHCLIPAKTCKEIRSYFKDQRGDFRLQVNCNLSQNIPSYYLYDDMEPGRAIRDPRPGMLDTDTTQFLPRPDEYIVDNEAPGFHILESTRSLKKQWQEKTEFTTLPLGQAPLRWTRYYGKQAYGEPVRSYYCKTAGEGSSRIEWETHLPEAGEYELLVYNDERDDQHVSYNKKEVVAKEPTQTYLFSHEEGSEEIVLETQNIGRGWVSLGRFLFPPGPAKITLLDRGADAGQIIFADAVKWVRKEKSTRIAPQE